MNTNTTFLIFWFVTISFSIIGIGRILFELKSISTDCYNEELNWNAYFNPFKIKWYCIFALSFLVPICLFKISVKPFVDEFGSYQILTNNNGQIPILLIAISIVGLIYKLLITLIPREIKSYKRNKTQIVKVFKELKPSKLNAEEIKKKFDIALNENYFDCEFSTFENLLKLNNPIEKIIWKPISHTKYKNRPKLLTFLNKLFENQLIKIERKEVCQFVNNYFEFNESNHIKQENPLKPDNIGDWIKKSVKPF